MKFIRNILTTLLMVGIVGSCGLNDRLVDPNEISPEQAGLNDLYNSVQLDFRDMYESAQLGPGVVSRMYMRVAFLYQSYASPTLFNNLWADAYNNLFPNVDALLALSEGNGFDIHVGTALIMKAYTMMILVDVLGDVPFSEAGLGTDVISPNLDPGADVYTAAIALLDEAIVLLTGTSAGAPASDNFYGGNPASWITAANTMKLRAALNMGNATMFNSIIAGGDFISSAGQDFQFRYGTVRLNPNTERPRNTRNRFYNRNPFYVSHYEANDGDYISNYYMWLLRSEKVDVGGNEFRDPRLRYYFYRKVDDAIGQDATTYSCHFSTLPTDIPSPPHYLAIDPRMPYCVASADGYSGRDHMNGEGIPPDGPIRTSYGLYPFGGDFDDDEFDDTRTLGIKGGLGGGIAPIMLSSFVDFMRAEAAIRFSGDAAAAEAHMVNGINASLDKVETFENLVADKMATTVTLRDGSSGTIKGLFGMDGASKADYVAKVSALYNAPGANQLDIVIKEFYIAAWGNGLEAYNMYRRTGSPRNFMPAMESPGPFPLSFFYPLNAETRNSNITQKGNLAVPVFWQDAGVASSLY